MELKGYRRNPKERARTEDLLEIIPRGRSTVLDIGARDGYISGLLTRRFEAVTALDLEKPGFDIPRVRTVKGDVTDLEFPDDHFDAVFCSEVLEHIPPALLGRACSEIARVAKYDVVIGVPYRQDTRVGRTTCVTCGRKNPPWGHVNTFDEAGLKHLFKAITHTLTTYVGETKERQNALSAWCLQVPVFLPDP